VRRADANVRKLPTFRPLEAVDVHREVRRVMYEIVNPTDWQ
jgi:hypothetical protein